VRAIRTLAAADDTAARAAAAAARVRYVDLFKLVRARRDPLEYLAGDRFHPSDAGHAAIAAVVLPHVRAALASRR
ncbi:MAG: GDSL-type esterase/lipase family protein, partial [Candidatus Velthaea sp.]